MNKILTLTLALFLVTSCGSVTPESSNSNTSISDDISTSNGSDISASIDAPKLATPVLHLVNSSLDWSNDRYAASYDIYKNDLFYINIVGSSWKIDINIEGEYKFYIVAKSKDYSRYADSDISNIVTYKYIKIESKSIELDIKFSSTKSNWVIPYLYADFDGEFKYYPLSLLNEKYIYTADIKNGDYHFNVFLGTFVDVDNSYVDRNYVEGGRLLSINSNKKYFFSSEFSSQPNEPQKYDVNNYYDGYYESIVSWTDSENLLSQINNLINTNFVSCSWEKNDYKWKILQEADECLDNLDRVDAIYTDTYDPLKIYTSTSTNNGWQREHAFAQSLGNFDTSSTLPDTEKADNLIKRSDWHNLFASDGSVNGGRGNKNIGQVSSSWGEIKQLKNSYGAESGCSYVEGVNVMEPNESEKGQLSRAILYMVSKYSDLHLVDDITEAHNVERATGCRKDIVSWASTYLVDFKEYHHNQVVSNYQKNRNPYVDYPDLVDFAFGSKSNLSVPDLAYLKPSYEELEINKDVSLNYAIKNTGHMPSATQEYITYEVGDSFLKSDFAIYDVKRDLINKIDVSDTLNYTVEPNIDYIFQESDIGIKQITFTIGEQVISYPIMVSLPDPIDSCSYNHQLTGKAQGDDFYDYRSSIGPFTANVVLNDVAWSVYLQAGKVGNNNETFGPSFGTSTSPCEKIVFSTEGFKTSENYINKIYAKCSTIKDGHFDFEIKIGGNSVYKGQVSDGNINKTLGITLKNKIAADKVELLFTNIEKTVRIKNIAVNITK